MSEYHINYLCQSRLATAVGCILTVLHETDALWANKCSYKSIMKRQQLHCVLSLLASMYQPHTFLLAPWIKFMSSRLSDVALLLASVTAMIKTQRNKQIVAHHMYAANDNVNTARLNLAEEIKYTDS